MNELEIQENSSVDIGRYLGKEVSVIRWESRTKNYGGNV